MRITFVSLTFVILLGWFSSSQAEETTRDLTSQLSAGKDLGLIADHLFAVRQIAGTTRALAKGYPNLTRAQAYQVQMLLLDKMLASGEKLAGWKMGGTKIVKPEDKLDPIFGFMLASDQYESGSTIGASRFGNDTPIIEAEIGFWISQDLPGPVVTRGQLEKAIGGLGGTSELISTRLRDEEGGTEIEVDHAIADGLSHGGFILPRKKFTLSQANFENEVGSVCINGNVIATGKAKIMMSGDPLAAVLALANRLPAYGHHLRKGEVVIIGSMLESPPAVAGDHVQIQFTTYEELSIHLTK